MRRKKSRRAKTFTTPFGRPIVGRPLPAKSPARNGPCPCGSGRKYKHCCRPKPQARPRPRTMYQSFRSQLTAEQREAETAFIARWGFIPTQAQLQVAMEGDDDELKQLVVTGLKALNADAKYCHAVQELGFLITSRNINLYSEEDKDRWTAALAEGETVGQAASGDS